MNKHVKNARNTLLMAVLSMVGLVSGQISCAAGDSVNLTFNYTVVQGSCDVSVGTDGSDGTLDFGTLDNTIIDTGSWQPLNSSAVKLFNVTLKNCTGSANASTTPGLTLTGTTNTTSTQQINAQYMFVDATTSTAKGLGFSIYKNSGTSTAADLVAEFSSSALETRKYIPIPGYTTKGSVVQGGVTVPLRAIVTCGQGTCDKTTLKSGELNAQVVFNFVYH